MTYRLLFQVFVGYLSSQDQQLILVYLQLPQLHLFLQVLIALFLVQLLL